MSNILTLVIAATLSSAVVLAEETVRTVAQNSENAVTFTMHGKTNCVLVDNKIFCAPGTPRTQIKLASASPKCLPVFSRGLGPPIGGLFLPKKSAYLDPPGR